MAENDDKIGGEHKPKTRLLTLSGLDRRTKAAQDALEARDAIIADLGGARPASPRLSA